MQQKAFDFGKPTVLEMKFSEHEDKDINVGQWVILFDEIPARKIGDMLYEVYAHASMEEVQALERSMERRPVLNFSHVPQDNFTIPIFCGRDIGLKDVGKGKQRRKPWESPKFY